MTQRFYVIFCLLFLVACDDGDIITVNLDFDKILKRCDNFENSYVVYDTRNDPNEALILILPKPASDYLFDTATTTPVELTIPSEAQFYYRTYNRPIVSTDTNEELCDVIPPQDLIIENSYPSNSGTVEVTVTFVDDDKDGIPSIFEDRNGNGNYDDDDFDGDGIPDYLDEDDDNDNVKTINEINNSDGDNDPTTNPQNTDGEDNPDYLDTDDDNDGVLTRLEDANGDKNPINDTVLNTTTNIEVPRYLYNHVDADEEFSDPGDIENVYFRVYSTHFLVKNAGLSIISTTDIDLGTYVSAEVEMPN